MEIDIKDELSRFDTFLSEDGNNNIVFSGIFGIGKTYFLRKYFENNDKYTPIYLTPINYIVSSNEDIFEYIKVDILFELIRVGANFNKEKCSFSLATQMYILESSNKLLANLLKMSEKIKFRTDFLDKIINFKKEIEDYKKDISIDEEEEAIGFLKNYTKQSGTIFEDNAITQLIRNLINSLKNSEKEIVLIIDDLDRIDPEHIFRILNVLSAHDNFYETNEHKFGFDKTIIVCDIDNIRNIYSTKYGITVDFNGYIDKFYSKEVYQFDNTKNIIKSIIDILTSIQSNQEIGINDICNLACISCEEILSSLIKSKAVNIRTLLKYLHKTYQNNRVLKIGNRRCLATNILSVNILDFIRSMFSTFDDMKTAIYKLRESDLIISNKDNFLRVFLALADYPQNHFHVNNYTSYDIHYNVGNAIDFGLIDIDYQNGTTEKIKAVDCSNILRSAFSNYCDYFA